MTVFFTSDTHFNHLKIVEHCKRPFASVEEMNETMIERWNAKVGPKDTIYHLGDFCWHEKGAREILERLNGNKHLIAGNHDHTRTLKLPWASVSWAMRIRHGSARIWASHYRAHGFREDLHFHGHEHNPKPMNRLRHVDVGVDAWGYEPVAIEEAVAAALAHPFLARRPGGGLLRQREETR